MPDTFHALATPSGTSALAVIRVCGPLVTTVVESAFGVKTSTSLSRKTTFGRYRDISGQVIDEVLFTWFPASSAFTGRETLEISTHGNPFIINQLQNDLAAKGVRPAEPGEFARTAFLEGKIDLSQAEAIADIIAARSQAALSSAHKQLAGGLGVEIEARVSEIVGILAHFEAFIDFPEEDLPPEDQEGPLKSLAETIRAIERMIATGEQRELLHRGIRTAIVGNVNAGKSSLLNRILGEDRVIVSDERGTTRDSISEVFALGRYCILISDTAGLRETSEKIESLGIKQTQKVYSNSDFFLIVIDGTEPPPTLPKQLIDNLLPNNSIVIFNKSDDLSFQPNERFLPTLPRVELSAKSGAGFDDFLFLWESKISEDLLKESEERIFYNQRHIGFLKTCQGHLDQALSEIKAGQSTEYVTPFLREALDSLGAIVGTIDNEEMLDVLFRDFCIGK